MNKETDLGAFEEKGEKYTRRGDLTTDTTRFKPNPDETYDSYRQRIFNTLMAQELEINDLREFTGTKLTSIDNLKAQLEPMRAQQAEMRLALAAHENGDDFAFEQKNRSQPLFHRYIVQKGDTLQRISHERFGTFTGWIALYRFNHSRLPYGPNRIDEGITLLVPDLDSLEALPMRESDATSRS